tara:strand:+ start:895 stop:1479 length:585 start_codon:yes stop_codon:yes gene_type:complete
MDFTKDGFIGIFDDAFLPQYCDDLIKYFNISGSKFVNATQGLKHYNDMDELYLHDPLTVQDVPEGFIEYFYQVLWNDIFPVYLKEFSVLKNAQPLTGFGLKMKKIAPGGGFHDWHYESIGERSPRKVVVQLYLNDIDEAGETEFLYQNKRISPKKGRLLLWPADWTYTHRGNPPIGKEDKYILTTWLEQARKGN